jgi:ABC-2 type transport system ATP-binding protein
MMKNAIEMQSVNLHFPKFALRDISMSLPEGCVMGLIGENGAGKTTMMKIILNVLRRDSGTVTVLGADPADPSFVRDRNRIGAVLQNTCFQPMLNLREIGKIMSRIYAGWDEQVYADLCRQYGLPEQQRLDTFSAGMKQKLNIIAALSHHPDLLILDEPMAGLDPIARNELTELLRGYMESEQHSILISSHILSDLEKIADIITCMHQGQIILSEEKDALLDRYVRVSCTDSERQSIAEETILSEERTPYGIRLIARRDGLPESLIEERPSLEEIVIAMAGKERAS